MSLLKTWNEYLSGTLTLEQTAQILGVNPETVIRRTKEPKENTVKLLGVLDLISQDKISRPEAAKVLEISERVVNIEMRKWKVSRPLRAYIVVMAYSKAKWEIRKKFATDFISGKTPDLEEAATSAGVSTRQIRRWVAELLLKHEGMRYKDLLTLGMVAREKLAEKILQAENIDEETQQMANEVAIGKQTLTKIAIEEMKKAKKTKTMKNTVRPKQAAYDRVRARKPEAPGTP